MPLQRPSVRPVYRQQMGDPIRVFEVTAQQAITGSNDSQGNPTQWTYTVKEQYKKLVGYGAPGRTATSGGWADMENEDEQAQGTAYNMNEDYQPLTGEMNNSVDHDGADYPTGFAMRPLRLNSRWPGFVVEFVDPDSPTGALVREIWLMGINGEDGTCS